MAGPFDDVRLPVDVEIGAQGGPSFSTGIVPMASGAEQRIQNWSVTRHKFTIGYGISDTDWQAVRAFFYARRGRARGFRFKDWTDFAVYQGTIINTAGQLNLVKVYADDIGINYVRQITRVVGGTLELTDDSGKDWTDHYVENYGRLVPTQPAGSYSNGLPVGITGNLSASFEYDIPVRFDVDELSLTIETMTAAQVDNLPIIELIENSDALNLLYPKV